MITRCYRIEVKLIGETGDQIVGPKVYINFDGVKSPNDLAKKIAEQLGYRPESIKAVGTLKDEFGIYFDINRTRFLCHRITNSTIIAA